MHSSTPLSCLALCAGSLAAGCSATPVYDLEPTVIVEGNAGRELGVSTDYGVVFLGAAARTGEIRITSFFGDGPGVEDSIVEPLGGGLFVAEAEIRLPSVPLAFETPPVGTSVRVRGRGPEGAWELDAEIVSDPRVRGLLLEATDGLAASATHTGAGVYVGEDRKEALLGLVSGRIRIESADGAREFVTVVGPGELWRLVTFRRHASQRPRWVYRDDVL